MTTTQRKTALGGAAGTTRPDSNSSAAQRQRLLEWLRLHGSIDTITARRELDILGVAQRIIELRKKYRIDTVPIKQPTDCGKLHRVALYVLKSEGVRND